MVDSTNWQSPGAMGLCSALILLVGAANSAAAEDEAQQAARELRQRHGLVRITGRVWGLPLEEQLRARLNGFPACASESSPPKRKWTSGSCATSKPGSRPAGHRLRADCPPLQQRPAAGRATDQLQLLTADVVEPRELAGRDAVRTQLSGLGQDRCALTLDLVWIRSAVLEVAQRYRQLAGDDQLARLIKQTGQKCRLGPARDYTADARKLDEYDALAFAQQVPIYLQTGRVRVTALVCDSACVTFSWSEASDAVVFLPASVLQAAGIQVPPDAPRRTLRIDGRTVESREIIVPSLRLGSCHARSLAVCVLPPEAEDLGAQLTPLALSPCRGRSKSSGAARAPMKNAEARNPKCVAGIPDLVIDSSFDFRHSTFPYVSRSSFPGCSGLVFSSISCFSRQGFFSL
jgi:hypothetical protein